MCEQFRQSLGEYRPRQHFPNARSTRRVDDIALDVRRVSHRTDRRESFVDFHGRDDAKRIYARVAQVEDDQGRRRLAHLLERGGRRAREHDGDAEVCRSGSYLGREQKIIENC